MFCPNCGKEILGNENFCPHCGKEASSSALLSKENNGSHIGKIEPPKIEIYRKSAFYGFLNDFKIYVDGIEIGRIGSGKKEVFSVEPGNHKIKVKITWWWDHSQEIAFTADNNTCTNFQCSFSFGLLGTLIGWGSLKSLVKGGNVIDLKIC